MSINRYVYGVNNPYRYTDPTGMTTLTANDLLKPYNTSEQNTNGVSLFARLALFINVLTVPGSTPESTFDFSPANELTKEQAISIDTSNNINLDTGTASALTSGDIATTSLILGAIGDKNMLMTHTALGEFMGRLRRANSLEAYAAAEVLMSDITLIPSMPSERVRQLKPSKVVLPPDQMIFGTGDQLGIKTITSDGKFPRAASQGVNLDVFVHPPASF